MTTVVEKNVDYRLLNRLSDLVICSNCLRSGKVTPVPQLICKNREITNVCRKCRSDQAPQGLRNTLGKLLQFPG